MIDASRWDRRANSSPASFPRLAISFPPQGPTHPLAIAAHRFAPEEKNHRRQEWQAMVPSRSRSRCCAPPHGPTLECKTLDDHAFDLRDHTGSREQPYRPEPSSTTITARTSSCASADHTARSIVSARSRAATNTSTQASRGFALFATDRVICRLSSFCHCVQIRSCKLSRRRPRSCCLSIHKTSLRDIVTKCFFFFKVNASGKPDRVAQTANKSDYVLTL